MNQVKVFIADDSHIIRERLVNMLDEIEGVIIVGQAETVPDAIQGILRLQPDVALLDIRMPGGSGIDVLQAIKKERVVPTVIILTQYPYLAYRQRCLEAGASYFFDKTNEFEKVPELLEQLTRN
ncbi:MAG: response regulator [Chloroflexi bacterium]|nr:response regulator [Chloroflexota bacterium]